MPGGDPLRTKEDGQDAPRVKDLVERYVEVHLPNLAKTNASDQRSMLNKLVGPDWNNRLVTEITPYDVEKLLNRIAEGRCRPHKQKPNNRARKLQRSKPTPVRAYTRAVQHWVSLTFSSRSDRRQRHSVATSALAQECQRLSKDASLDVVSLPRQPVEDSIRNNGVPNGKRQSGVLLGEGHVRPLSLRGRAGSCMVWLFR